MASALNLEPLSHSHCNRVTCVLLSLQLARTVVPFAFSIPIILLQPRFQKAHVPIVTRCTFFYLFLPLDPAIQPFCERVVGALATSLAGSTQSIALLIHIFTASHIPSTMAKLTRFAVGAAGVASWVSVAAASSCPAGSPANVRTSETEA